LPKKYYDLNIRNFFDIDDIFTQKPQKKEKGDIIKKLEIPTDDYKKTNLRIRKSRYEIKR
jgi:hypothetical protein